MVIYYYFINQEISYYVINQEIMLLIKKFLIGPFTGPRSAVLAEGYGSIQQTEDL